MAYTLYEELQLKSPKSIQYYPEEYDYPAYYDKISSMKSSFNTPIQNIAKKSKKTMSVNYENEKKCPIYVHQPTKHPTSSTYNNYSSLNKNLIEKSITPRVKKNFHATKSVLDQLEETYWATWKPNKENNAMIKPRKIRAANEDRYNKNKAYGDTSETLVRYFATADFTPSTMSVLEDNNEKLSQRLELVRSPNIYDIEKFSARLLDKNNQKIQTDGYPLILPKIEENIESGTNIENDDAGDGSTKSIPVKSEEAPEPKPTHDEVVDEKEKSDSEDESNMLKHTDSLIINKKKQSEVKEHFQQPKCIKLYKKPGASTSFIRGGSYPLKSCLKREPVQKGNFKLGAPGSPILVTTSSYNRKSRK